MATAKNDTVSRIGAIYRATNNKNGKVYIGQTISTLKIRQSGHYTDSKRGNSKINRAIAKYGIDGFVWEILHDAVPVGQLDYVEQYEICMHGSYENGYNTTIGGDVNPMKGNRHTKEAREKITKALTGRQHSKETLEKKRRSMLGKTLSEAAKIKISNNHVDVSGDNNPMYGVSLYEHWNKKFGPKAAAKKIIQHKQRLSNSITDKMSGCKNPSAKLTQEMVNEMRNLYRHHKYNLKQLSEKYKVSKANVCLIVNYKTWVE